MTPLTRHDALMMRGMTRHMQRSKWLHIKGHFNGT